MAGATTMSSLSCSSTKQRNQTNWNVRIFTININWLHQCQTNAFVGLLSVSWTSSLSLSVFLAFRFDFLTFLSFHCQNRRGNKFVAPFFEFHRVDDLHSILFLDVVVVFYLLFATFFAFVSFIIFSTVSFSLCTFYSVVCLRSDHWKD